MDPRITPIIRPLTDGDRDAAGAVYARAFPLFMKSMVPRHGEHGATLMADLIDPSADIWVAEVDGAVAGLAWVQDPARPAPEHAVWKLLRPHLPATAALRAWVFSYMLHGVSVSGSRLYLDSLAVDPALSGRGIGGALLAHVTAEARRRHKAAVCLYVVDRDERARSIYRHIGFRTVRSEGPRLFRSVIGFHRTDYMELPLTAATEATDGGPPPAVGIIRGLIDRILWRRLPTPVA